MIYLIFTKKYSFFNKNNLLKIPGKGLKITNFSFKLTFLFKN